MYVVLIEPDRLLARIYAQALVAAGHSVAVALSAQSAVHAADNRQPDVVILELQLQHHNGTEFLYEFRSYSEWLHIPIIIHTFVPPGELTSAVTLDKELGVKQVLYKPTTSLRAFCAAIASLATVAT